MNKILAFLGVLILIGVSIPILGEKSLNTPDLAQRVAIPSPPIVDRGGVEGEDIPCAGKHAWCGTYVRELSEWQPPIVKNVLDIPATVFSPKKGAWVLFKYNHVGYVSRVIGTSSIEIKEFNYPERCVYNTRILSVDDDTIRGYFGIY